MQLWMKRPGTQQLPCHPLPFFHSLASFTGAEQDMRELGGGQEAMFPTFFLN